MRFPRPLEPGDRIGVTSPSLGVNPVLREQVADGIGFLRERGYDVVVGDLVEARDAHPLPTPERAAELQDMLLDPSIPAVAATIGGEAAVRLLPLLDWDALADAEPTWLVGASDITVVQVALASRLGWASLHANAAAAARVPIPATFRHWLDVVASHDEVVQRSPGVYRSSPYFDFTAGVDTMEYDARGAWSVLGHEGDLDVSGRLVGGCLDVLVDLPGSPYGRVSDLAGDDGLLVFLEAAEGGAIAVDRALWGLRLAGWFDRANAVLIGRSYAPDDTHLTQREAVEDALGDLGVPVVLDVECGHAQPRMPFVQGSLARIIVDGDRHEVRQRLV